MAALAFTECQNQIQPIEDELEKFGSVDAPAATDIWPGKSICELERKQDISIFRTADKGCRERHIVACAEHDSRPETVDLGTDKPHAPKSFKVAMAKWLPAARKLNTHRLPATYGRNRRVKKREQFRLERITHEDDPGRDARLCKAVGQKHGHPVAAALAKGIHDQQDAATPG
jgi:hypothetical protein